MTELYAKTTDEIMKEIQEQCKKALSEKSNYPIIMVFENDEYRAVVKELGVDENGTKRVKIVREYKTPLQQNEITGVIEI